MLVVVRGLGAALQALTLVLLARLLPMADLGHYAVIVAIAAITRFLGPFGLDQIVLRGEIRGGSGSGPRVNASIQDAVSTVLLVSSSISLLTFCVCLAIDSVFTGLLAIACAALPAYAATGILAAHVRASGRNVAAQIPESLVLPAANVAALVAVEIMGALTTTASVVVLAACAWSVFAIYLRLSVQSGGIYSRRLNLASMRTHVRECLGITVGFSLTAVSSRAPVLLAAMLISPAAAALMEVAHRFGNLSSLIATSVATTYSPGLAGHLRAAELDQALRLLVTGSISAAAAAGAFTLVLGLAYPWLPGWLLPMAYAPSFGPMLVLATAASVNAAFALASTYFLMAGRPAVVSAFSLLQLVVIVAVAWAGSSFGLIAIAVATLLGTLCRDGGLAVKALRELKKP